MGLFSKVFPSAGNFVLIRVNPGILGNKRLCDILIEKYNLFLHDSSNKFKDNNEYYRIAVRTKEDNKFLIEALKKIKI